MNLSALDKATKGNTRTTGISPFMELEITKVYPNPNQPRKSFENIEELANSIAENGLIQPIAVVKKDDGYMIISGERRYRASLIANARTIKTIIIEADDKQVLELALVENIQREDLTDFEKAVHIGKLWASRAYEKKQDLALAIGKTQSYISKAFSSLKLDEEIIADIKEAKHDISLSVLDELSRVKDKEIQKEVYAKYLNKEITREGIAAHKNAESENGFKQRMKKKEKILTSEVYTKEQFLKYFMNAYGHRLKEDKTYKITIEEV